MENVLIAEIIPIIKLPRSLGVFDYIIPKEFQNEIKIGCMVEIPFRKKIIYGVINKIKKDPHANTRYLKNINKIIDNNFIIDYQMHLLRWMSGYYYQSPSLVIKSMIPKFPKRLENKNETIIQQEKNSNLTNHASPLLSHNKILFIGHEIHEDIITLIQYYHYINKQVLILFPEISKTSLNAKEYEKYYKKGETVIITSKMPVKKMYIAWKKILYNEYKLILGTRKIIFFPFSSLGLIIVEDEEDQSYKQWDMNPRYNARDVAIKISELTGAQLVLKSISPSVQSYSKIYKNYYLIDDIKKKSNFIIIDMRNEKREYPYSFFSDTFLQYVKNLKHQALILANHKGTSSSIICRDCGFIPKCENCGNPYYYYEYTVPKFVCYNCHIIQPMLRICPTCHGIHFNFIGTGIQKIYKELKKLFPKCQIEYFDSDLTKMNKDIIIKNYINKKIQLVVSTTAIFNELPLHHKIEFSAILSLESFLSIPDYTATEKTWQIIMKLSQYSETILVQTYDSENIILNNFKTQNYKKFYNAELNIRKKFHYPPYSKLIKIIIQNKNENESRKRAMILYNELKKMSRNNNSVEIFEPLQYSKIIIRGQFRFNIIIKIKNNNIDISPWLQKIPENNIIDVDPINLS